MSEVDRVVIETLADSEAALGERVADLECDVVTYRDLFQRTLTYVHNLQNRIRHDDKRHHRLLEEYRQLRVRVILEDRGKTGSASDPVSSTRTLSDAGIDKHLSENSGCYQVISANNLRDEDRQRAES